MPAPSPPCRARVGVLLETTAGSGTALGATFEEPAELRHRIPPPLRRRVGFCANTCHLYSAGYDLVGDFDSPTPFGSRRDRHQLIGEGSLSPEPFRRLMADPRFRAVIKIIETPKGDDPPQMDRTMLRRLRAYARAPGRVRSVASAPRRADL